MKTQINIHASSQSEASAKASALEKISQLDTPALEFLAGLDASKANKKLGDRSTQSLIKTFI